MFRRGVGSAAAAAALMAASAMMDDAFHHRFYEECAPLCDSYFFYISLLSFFNLSDAVLGSMLLLMEHQQRAVPFIFGLLHVGDIYPPRSRQSRADVGRHSI